MDKQNIYAKYNISLTGERQRGKVSSKHNETTAATELLANDEDTKDAA